MLPAIPPPTFLSDCLFLFMSPFSLRAIPLPPPPPHRLTSLCPYPRSPLPLSFCPSTARLQITPSLRGFQPSGFQQPDRHHPHEPEPPRHAV